MFGLDEERREDGQKQGAAHEHGGLAELPAAKAAGDGAEQEHADHLDVAPSGVAGRFVVVVKAAGELHAGAAQVAGAEGGGERPAVRFLEAVVLDGTDERDGQGGGEIGQGSREPGDAKQQRAFAAHGDAVPLEEAPARGQAFEPFGQEDAEEERGDGSGGLEGGGPLGLGQAQREQHEVAGLGVGEDAAFEGIGIGFQKPADGGQAQAGAHAFIGRIGGGIGGHGGTSFFVVCKCLV